MNTYPEIGKTNILDISSPKKCSDQVNRDNIRGLSEEFDLDDPQKVYSLEHNGEEYKFDPRGTPRLDARDWKYSRSPIGYVTIFMDLPTLAAWNYGSFNEFGAYDSSCRCATMSMFDASTNFGLSMEISTVYNDGEGYLSKRILPATEGSNGHIGYVDAGWAILEAMHHLGFDTGKFRALVNFKHKDKAKRGLYMTFKLPTIEEPAIERSASEIYNSNDPITKGDIGRIFQDALNNGGV